jgi:cation transport ATPase
MAAYVILGPGVPLSVGVGVHEGSTVIVCLNGLRLLAHRPSRES